MTSRLRSQLLCHIFKLSVVENDNMEFFKFVNNDFPTPSLNAMGTLFKARKHNLIYNVSKCFEHSRPRMPLHRMPYGLLDYNIRFFAGHRMQKFGMEYTTHHGLKPCLLNLAKSLCASTGDQLGGTPWWKFWIHNARRL